MGITVEEILRAGTEKCIRNPERVRANIEEICHVTVLKLLNQKAEAKDAYYGFPEDEYKLEAGSSGKMLLTEWMLMCKNIQTAAQYPMNPDESKVFYAQLITQLLLQSEKSSVGHTFNNLSFAAWCDELSNMLCANTQNLSDPIDFYERAKHLPLNKIGCRLKEDTTIGQLLQILRRNLFNCSRYRLAFVASDLVVLLFAEPFRMLAELQHSMPASEIKENLIMQYSAGNHR